MLLVHCMTAQMMTAISHVALKAEINSEKTIGLFSFVLKLNRKCNNINALLGNDKILMKGMMKGTLKIRYSTMFSLVQSAQ